MQPLIVASLPGSWRSMWVTQRRLPCCYQLLVQEAPACYELWPSFGHSKNSPMGILAWLISRDLFSEQAESRSERRQ